MFRLIIACIIASFAMTSVSSAGQHSSQEQKAISAAKSWLSLVDSGDYARSWQEASEYFRRAVSGDQWAQSLTAVRKPLGRVQKRSVRTANYVTSLPGAPDGDYVVIQFATSFDRKKKAVETVTPMRDSDGVWRVSGYYIK